MQLRTATIAMLLSLLSPVVHTARAQERWDPVSKTAMSITGPVSLFRDHVRFGTGATLAVAAVGRPMEMDMDGQVMTATIYRVTAPRELLLLGDNTLCGAGLPSWIVAGASGVSRALAVYSGAVAPPENKRLCGTFRYEVAAR
jgi:hypothetical protein